MTLGGPWGAFGEAQAVTAAAKMADDGEERNSGEFVRPLEKLSWGEVSLCAGTRSDTGGEESGSPERINNNGSVAAENRARALRLH